MIDRPAIVTGASSGIGRAAAIALSKAGASVLLTSRRKELLERTAAECEQPALAISGDITQPDFVEELVRVAREASGDGLPVLVNAAGAAHFGPTSEMSVEEIENQLRVNLLAPILTCKAAIPWMLERGGGDIVNVASIAATHPFPQAAAYAASKAGLLGFSRSLSAEYRSSGIRVTTLLPGSTDTPLWDSQSFSPERSDMLSAEAVAEAIMSAVAAPRDRSFDEIVLMPPKGIL